MNRLFLCLQLKDSLLRPPNIHDSNPQLSDYLSPMTTSIHLLYSILYPLEITATINKQLRTGTTSTTTKNRRNHFKRKRI